MYQYSHIIYQYVRDNFYVLVKNIIDMYPTRVLIKIKINR